MNSDDEASSSRNGRAVSALTCGRCGKALTGRQQRWCSRTCSVYFGREQERRQRKVTVTVTDPERPPKQVADLPDELLDLLLLRCSQAAEVADAHEARQWALAAVSINSMDSGEAVNREHIVHEVELMLDRRNAAPINAEAQRIVEAHAELRRRQE